MLNRSNSNIETSSRMISTHQKTVEKEKSTQPLRFRSFDEFYKEYNRKSYSSDSKSLNPPSKTPIKNTSVKDKIELLTACKNKESVASKPILLQSSDIYNIKGRVKRLCEKFQKCEGSSHFCGGLRDVIASVKGVKTYTSPKSVVSSEAHRKPAEGKLVDLLPAMKTQVKPAGTKDAANVASPTVLSDTKLIADAGLYKVADTKEGPLGDLPPVIAKPESTTGLDQVPTITHIIAKNAPKDRVVVEKKPEASSQKAKSQAGSASIRHPSPPKPTVVTRSASSGVRPSGDKPISVTSTHLIYSKSLSQRKTTLNTPRTELLKYGQLTCGISTHDINKNRYSLKNSLSTTEDSFSPGVSESESLPRQSSNTSLKSEDEALIDQVVGRIMGDQQFCNAFFDKLEELNLGSKSESLQLDSMIDDLQLLVDEDEEPETAVSQETRKAFDWYFNQPQVFDLEFTERNDRNLVTTIEESDLSECGSLMGDKPPSRTSLKGDSPSFSSKPDSFNWLSLYNHTRNPASTGYEMASGLNNSSLPGSFRDNSHVGGYNSGLFKSFDLFSFLG